jgi:hypothetical protein
MGVRLQAKVGIITGTGTGGGMGHAAAELADFAIGGGTTAW